MGPDERLHGHLPRTDPASAAGEIAADATVLTSGFGSVGYPKAVPEALAESDRDLALTVVSGGSVGPEIDTALVEADALERRYPFQSRPEVNAAVNDGRVAFNDRHISSLGDEVRFGGLVDPDVAVVEAVAVGEDWLIPSTSVGHTPPFVDAVDKLVVEVNRAQPRELAAFHDVYRLGDPPGREGAPLSAPGERVGDPRVSFATSPTPSANPPRSTKTSRPTSEVSWSRRSGVPPSSRNPCGCSSASAASVTP